MPTTSVENSSGAMIILIIRRNRSASGLMATPTSGQRKPMSDADGEPDEDLGRQCDGRGGPPAAAAVAAGIDRWKRIRPRARRGRRDDHVGLLVRREFAVDRQRQRLGGGAPPAAGKSPRAIAERREALLLVERHRVVDGVADAARPRAPPSRDRAPARESRTGCRCGCVRRPRRAGATRPVEAGLARTAAR